MKMRKKLSLARGGHGQARFPTVLYRNAGKLLLGTRSVRFEIKQ